MLDKIMNVSDCRSRNNFFQGNIGATVVPVRDVLSNRHIEQNGFLRHNADCQRKRDDSVGERRSLLSTDFEIDTIEGWDFECLWNPRATNRKETVKNGEIENPSFHLRCARCWNRRSVRLIESSLTYHSQMNLDGEGETTIVEESRSVLTDESYLLTCTYREESTVDEFTDWRIGHIPASTWSLKFLRIRDSGRLG